METFHPLTQGDGNDVDGDDDLNFYDDDTNVEIVSIVPHICE